MYGRQFQGFGWIAETIVGVAQAAALGAASAIQRDKIKKAQKKESSLLDILHTQRLSEIEAAKKESEEAAGLRAEAAVYEEKALRSFVYVGVIGTILASMGIVYIILRRKK